MRVRKCKFSDDARQRDGFGGVICTGSMMGQDRNIIANNAIDEAINNPRIVFSNVDLCEVYGPDSIDVKQAR